MSKVFKILFVLILSFIFCISFVYASDVTMDLPNNTASETVNEEPTNNTVSNGNVASNSNTDNSLANEYLEGSNDNSILASNPLGDSSSHEQPVGISTNSSGLSISSIINILLIAVGIIIIFLAIAIIIRLK